MPTTRQRSRNGREARRTPTTQPRLDLQGPELQAFGTLRHLPIGLPEPAQHLIDVPLIADDGH